MSDNKAVFKRVLKGAAGGKKFEPLLMNALYDPQYKSFTVKMRAGKGSTRKPDGWFHPSTHPLWPERQLYYYLSGSKDLVTGPLDPLGTLATTAGTFWHEFIQHVATEAGILVDTEVYVEDPECKSRGSMDGVTADGEAWEFKTANPMKLAKVEKGDPSSPEVLESFRKNWPVYYAQAQEYLRMSGYRTMRVTIMEPCYPFNMREVAIPYSAHDAMIVRDKYMRVIQDVADQRLPVPCCAPGSAEAKACFARSVCPVGRMS